MRRILTQDSGTAQELGLCNFSLPDALGHRVHLLRSSVLVGRALNPGYQTLLANSHTSFRPHFLVYSVPSTRLAWPRPSTPFYLCLSRTGLYGCRSPDPLEHRSSSLSASWYLMLLDFGPGWQVCGQRFGTLTDGDGHAFARVTVRQDDPLSERSSIGLFVGATATRSTIKRPATAVAAPASR